MRIPRFKLERFFADYEFNVEHLLCGSDCESLSIRELLALEPGSEQPFLEHRLGYTESQGSPHLREAVAEIYETLSPEDVLVHAGAQEAIFTLTNALLEAGDHVVVHEPSYQSLSEIARSIGCDVTPWQARETVGWALDVDELESILRPETKMIILNLPHNPTGTLMDADSFERVSQLAQDRGILLFCDEVYRELEYDSACRLPAACDVGEHAISLGVMSKTYGLPGLRIGWLATRNHAVLRRIAEFKDYTTICSSAPSEWLATLALQHRHTLISRNLAIVRANLALLDEFIAQHDERFSWVRPGAGSIAFPRLLHGDIDKFVHRLVEQESVLLLPGTVFGDTGNHFRIGFGRSSFPEGLARLGAHLR